MKTADEHEGGRMALSELAEGEWGVIESLELPPDVQNQLMHMGFMPEAPVQSLRRAPAGDPTVYSIDGAEVALRRETAEGIHVVPFTGNRPAESASSTSLSVAEPTPVLTSADAGPSERLEGPLEGSGLPGKAP